jgi:hypothetical protein
MSASSPSHHAVTSLTITGGHHFPELSAAFPDGLTCVIGARGTGKTGILWAVCFGLGLELLEPYAAELDAYVRDTLGRATVVVGTRTEHGAKHTWSRRYGEPPVVRDESGAIVKVSIDGGALFAVQAFSQGQIEDIARNHAEQLALLDGFALAEIRAIDTDVDALERRLDRCDAELRRLEGDVAADAATEEELATVLEALKGAALGAAAGAPGQGEGVTSSPAVSAGSRVEREQAHVAKVERGRERVTMASLASEIGRVRDGLDAFARDALRRLGGVEGAHERGPHGEIFRAAHAAMQALGSAVEVASGRLRVDVASAERAIDEAGRALTGAHAKKDEAYEAVVVRDDDDRRRAAQAAGLQKRLEELSVVARRLADKRRQEAAARAEWSALLAERSRLVSQKSALRKQIAKRLEAPLEGEVEADVIPRASTAAFAAVLTEMVKGEGFQQKYVEAVARRLPPEDLASIAATGELEPLVEVDPYRSEKTDRAKRFLDALRKSGRLRDLERVRLDDLPVFRLRVKGEMQPSEQLSTGQRCSLALLLLLQPSKAPLLVDQAEDSLDNEFIYCVLVQRIAAVKGARQILLVTHNPNPPTLAHAEQILALDVDESGHGKVAAHGSFDDVRTHVERLEGGRKAFLERGERYGHFRREAEPKPEPDDDE